MREKEKAFSSKCLPSPGQPETVTACPPVPASTSLIPPPASAEEWEAGGREREKWSSSSRRLQRRQICHKVWEHVLLPLREETSQGVKSASLFCLVFLMLYVQRHVGNDMPAASPCHASTCHGKDRARASLHHTSLSSPSCQEFSCPLGQFAGSVQACRQQKCSKKRACAQSAKK